MIHCVGEPEKNPSHGNLEVPSFIKEVLPLWKLGDFLPEQIRNKMFTSDPSTLYILKRDLMQSLTPVKLRKEIKEMEEGDVQYLESMLGRGDNEEADIESEIKIPDFTDYVSPNKPRGQRELLNDYLYIWTTHKRLRGNIGICCGVGKVNLPLFPQPPQPILDLWISQSQEAKLFRENCRSINNAVCL